MSRRVGADEQGQLQGANASVSGIASMIGPGIFSLSFAWAIKPDFGGELAGHAVRARRGAAARRMRDCVEGDARMMTDPVCTRQ